MKLHQATLFSLVLFMSVAQAEVPKHQWITTWAASPQKVWNKDFFFPTLIPEQISNQTIRQVSQISLGGEAVRLVFTNQYGEQPLYIDQTTIGLANAASLKSKSTYPVYFSGQLKARILPGKQLISDPIQLPVPDHAQLVVNSFIQKPTTFKTFHWDAKQTSWLISGNQTTNFTTPTDAKTTTARLLLSAIEVKPKQKAQVVAVIGDSITDGATATLDANSRWTDFLAKRLSAHQVAVINSGISGNRLLTDGMGDSVLKRLNSEVFQYSGVKTLIVLIGINDISWPTYYDPMIAKLIVWGKNREAALIQMQHALSQFHVDGLGNNIAFLEKIVRSESFKQAKLDTNLIHREQNFLFSPEEIKPELVVAAAFIEFLSKLNNNSSSQKQLWQAQPLWRLNIAYQHSIKLNYLNQNIQIKFASHEHGFTAEYNGQSYPISGQLIDAHTASIQIGGSKQKLSFNQSQQGITLFQNGQSYKFAYIRQDFNQADSQTDEGHLKAPMPGVVTQVLVSANHSVKKDDILMTLEAMKMEYTIRAPKDGLIVDSYFQVGDQVKAGDELVEFQPAQEEVA